jgi:intein/homing endonuclease
MSNKPIEWQRQYIENAWMGLGDTTKIQTINPLEAQTPEAVEQPLVHCLDLMRQPEYFYFTVKHLFGIRLHPFQLAILQELWKRPFPMLIGSRGLGKCVRGDTLVHTNQGICRIDELAQTEAIQEPVFKPGLTIDGENGFRDVAYSWNNGMSETVRIESKMGFELEGTLNHPVRVVADGKVVWRNLADVRVGDSILVERRESWHTPEKSLPEDLAYLLGLIAGDDGFTLTTADSELAEVVAKYWGKAKYAYTHSSKETLAEYGFPSSVCEEKDVPRSILTGSKEACAAFLRGLYDTNGGVDESSVHLSAKSEKLIRTVQFLLTRFGIIAKRSKPHQKNDWVLEIRSNDLVAFRDKIGFGLTRKQLPGLKHNTDQDFVPYSIIEKDVISLMQMRTGVRRQSGTTKFSRNYCCTYEWLNGFLAHMSEYYNTDAHRRLREWVSRGWYFDTISKVSTGRCVTYDVHVPEGNSFISNGFVSHNSFIVALYAMLRGLFHQGSKIVIVGAAFRQAKVVFDYCADFWEKSPILRDIVGDNKKNGPRRDIDRCTLRLGESLLVALPLGDGCLSADTMVTYEDGFGTIGEDSGGVAEPVVARERRVWSSERKEFVRSDESYFNGVKDTKVLTTALGLRLEGTHNHKIRVLEGLEFVWKRLDQVRPGDRLPIDRSWRWHKGQEPVTTDEAYTLGLMIGDGCWTNPYKLGCATMDQEWLYRGTNISDHPHFNAYDKSEHSTTKDKVLPPAILRAGRDAMSACIRGLYDTNGYIQVGKAKSGVTVGFTNSSERLVRQLQFILLHFGIISRLRIREHNEKYELLIYGQDVRRFAEHIGFRLSHKSHQLKEALSAKQETCITREFVDKYAHVQDAFLPKLRELANPDIYYDTIEEIVDSSCATYDIHVPDIHEYCAFGIISHNSKIRGQRANIIISDEFACLDRDTLIETDCGLVRIGDHEADSGGYALLQPDDSKPIVPDLFVETPPTEAYRVTTTNGYEFVCSSIHKVLTTKGWKLGHELSAEDYLVHQSSGRFPETMASVDGSVVDEAFARATGRELSAQPGKIPWFILRSPREVVVSFLSGLFDKGKALSRTIGVSSCRYESPSEQLVRELQVLLHKFGIVCHRSAGEVKGCWCLRFDSCSFGQLFRLLDSGVSGAEGQKPSCERVRLVEALPGQRVLYDYHVPGTHRFIGNCFIQHNSIPKDIFETVVRGFAAVNMNPVDEAIQEARKSAIRELGLWTDAHQALQESMTVTNQTIISGTAYYSFNHFYDYWKRYKAIIESKGDLRKLAEAFGGPDKVDKNLNWKDYCIIRIPVEALPPGFMNPKQIAQAKATVHIGTYQMEYGAVFATDSNGFFKRSLIEACVVGRRERVIEHPSSGPVHFNAVLKGVPNRHYVMGVDPASELDNFSIVVLECWPEHRRIVYCWTTTRSRFKSRLEKGLASDQDFYGFCARKIRELLAVFPCQRICMDMQGGGVSIIEALQDTNRLQPGEVRILPIIDEKKPSPTDVLSGEHIIETAPFANADWVRDANHGMRKDFEDRALLFPAFDPAIVALAFEEDKALGRVQVDPEDSSVRRLYDTLEDCVMEIEELKDELASIIHTQTGTSMRDRWDTPSVKSVGSKKGRLRKDRYSALLMANMVGRTLQRQQSVPEYDPQGGFAHSIGPRNTQGDLWIARDGQGGWWAENWKQHWGKDKPYGAVVRRD